MGKGETTNGKINWTQAWSESPYLPHWATAVWKTAIGLFGLSILFWSLSIMQGSPYWLIYLTHWMLLTHCVYLVFQAITTVNVHFRVGRDSEVWKKPGMPLFIRATWFCQIVCIPGGLLVCILYWNLLAPPNPPVQNYFVHALVWAVCMLDFLIGMQPYVLVQNLWFVIWALFYAIWTIIQGYSGIGNGYAVTDPNYCECVYGIVNWKVAAGKAALFAFGVPLVAVPILCFVIWITNFFRIQAIYKINGLSDGRAIVIGKGDGNQV